MFYVSLLFFILEIQVKTQISFKLKNLKSCSFPISLKFYGKSVLFCFYLLSKFNKQITHLFTLVIFN